MTLNQKEIRIMSKLIKTQFTSEERRFLSNFLAQCHYYLNDDQRQLSVEINKKLGFMDDFSKGI